MQRAHIAIEYRQHAIGYQQQALGELIPMERVVPFNCSLEIVSHFRLREADAAATVVRQDQTHRPKSTPSRNAARGTCSVRRHLPHQQIVHVPVEHKHRKHRVVLLRNPPRPIRQPSSEVRCSGLMNSFESRLRCGRFSSPNGGSIGLRRSNRTHRKISSIIAHTCSVC